MKMETGASGGGGGGGSSIILTSPCGRCEWYVGKEPGQDRFDGIENIFRFIKSKSKNGADRNFLDF